MMGEGSWCTHMKLLKDRAYETDLEFDPKHEKTQWQRFERQVDQLNHEGGSKTQYKVLYSRC